jgi:predicted metal-dependent peptidase
VSFDLKLHAYRLLMDEPFFAALSRKIEKREDRSISTAGVRVDPVTAQFEMIYNPEFLASLPEEQVRGVLKHEFYHLIFDHVTSRSTPAGVSHKLWNICQDLAINSHLQGELPDWACMPGRKDTPFENLPFGQTAEWYLKELEDQGHAKQQKMSPGDGEPGDQEPGEPGEGNEGDGDGSGLPGQLDDHSNWADSGDSAAQQAANQMAKERLKQAMKAAAQEASQSPKGWGSMSADVKKEIIKRLETKVDWKKVMRYFIKTSQRASKTSTVKRIDRRYPYIHPGKKIKRLAKIAIAIDQSGSVSDEMLENFFGELNKLAKLAEFTVIPFDDEVPEDKVYTWKKGQNKKAERVSCGGTDFNAPTDYVNKHSFDGVIILTDMEAPKPKRCKAQRMWMTDQRGASRPYFKTNERVIAID